VAVKLDLPTPGRGEHLLIGTPAEVLEQFEALERTGGGYIPVRARISPEIRDGLTIASAPPNESLLQFLARSADEIPCDVGAHLVSRTMVLTVKRGACSEKRLAVLRAMAGAWA
jgi:hypothetical protein